MGTIADKLNKLLSTKEGIKAALIEKGQAPSNVFSQYPNMIREIIKLSNISITKQPTKTSYNAKESFNSAGMEVKALFSNDAYKFVTNYTVEPSGALKPTDTKIKITYTEFGDDKEAEVAITVSPIKLTVPSQSKTITYTGSTLSPTWSNYNSSLMTVSGSTSGTNAGNYTAKFALKDKTNYRWSDGTTADKSVTWTIGKAQASISLSKNSVTLNSDKLTDTVTITSVGMNSIAAMSSDTSIATISMSGNTLTISNVNETTGTATIVLSGEVNSNYNAPSYPTIAVNAEFAEMVTVKIKQESYYYNGSYVTIDGQTYTAENNGAEINVPVGTVIYCCCIANSKESEDGDITLNGVSVDPNETFGMTSYYEYEHTVNGNITISFDYSEGDESYIRITEVPAGYVAVKITGSGNVNHVYLSVDGVKYYTTQTIVLPIGQTIYLFTRQNDSGTNGYIMFNGSEVRRDDNGSGVEYNHTLNRDVSVYLFFYKGGGYINIVEL